MELTDLLDRPIAFHRPLAKLAGSISAGLLLSQAVYWSRRTDDQDGWFWKTQSEWEEETCLTRREQESARALLRRLEYSGRPLWLEERRGVPAKSYYRVDFQVLGALLLNFQNGEKRHSRMAENAKLDCTNPPNWNGGKRDSSMSFFARRGNRQVIAGYYDSPDVKARLKQWLDAADKVDGVAGVMYTTWRSNYSHMEVFYESLNDYIGGK